MLRTFLSMLLIPIGLLLLLTFLPVLLIADTAGILPQPEQPAEAA